jgi:hypothetical protein
MEIPPAAMTCELVVGKYWINPKRGFGSFGYYNVKQAQQVSLWVPRTKEV